jgi:threonine dehydrogenase-like Zn-dependent dehydrogenase
MTHYPNRSWYVRSPWRMELRENPVPAPGPGQVLLDIGACGICGTDVHVADRAAPEWQMFGHEIAGVVRAVGDGVRRFAAGDRVAVDSTSPCGACETCLPRPYGRGRPELCPQPASFWGGPTMGFGEMLLAPQQCCAPVPAGMPLEVACLAEPLGVSLELVRAAEVGPGDHVLVVGPGPLGLAAVYLARRAGAERIVLAGLSESEARFEVGCALGADDVVRVDRTPLATCDFAGRKPDRVLSTTPPRFLPEAVGAAALGGTISYIGIAWDETANITMDSDYLHFQKLTLRGAHPCPGTHGPECLRILEAAPELARALVSHRFPMEELPRAMELARDERTGVIKAVVVRDGVG